MQNTNWRNATKFVSQNALLWRQCLGGQISVLCGAIPVVEVTLSSPVFINLGDMQLSVQCYTSFGRKTFGWKTIIGQQTHGRHLTNGQIGNKHLAKRHMADRHMAIGLMADKHLAKIQMANRPLSGSVTLLGFSSLCQLCCKRLCRQNDITTFSIMTLSITKLSMMTLYSKWFHAECRAEFHARRASQIRLLRRVPLCWMSLCWVPWRQQNVCRQNVIRPKGVYGGILSKPLEQNVGQILKFFISYRLLKWRV